MTNEYFNHDKPLTPQTKVLPAKLNPIFKAIAAGFDAVAEKLSIGGVVESGSDANGSFVRYADGTQIARGVAEDPGDGTLTSITLPAAFVNTNYTVSATVTQIPSAEANNTSTPRITGKTASILTIDAAPGSTAKNALDWIAIGLWK